MKWPMLKGIARYARRKLAFTKGAKDRIVFIHTPRCGGSSLRTAIEAHYPQWDRIRFNPPAARGVTRLLGLDPKKTREAIFLSTT